MWCTPTKQGTSDILDKMSFWYGCKEHTFRCNLIPKSCRFIFLLLFEIWPFVYKIVSSFSESVILKNFAFKVSHSYSFGFDKLQKMQIVFVENVWKSVRNYMEMTENTLRYVKKNRNLKIDRWYIFHPYTNFNCPYLKIGLCDLFPVLLVCITNLIPLQNGSDFIRHLYNTPQCFYHVFWTQRIFSRKQKQRKHFRHT